MSLSSAFASLSAPRIAVLGDVMLDRYLWGGIDRISPEAPVPVLAVGPEEERPGGGANVAANLVDLGSQASLFALIGQDEAGARLRAAIESGGVATSGVIAASRPTTQKTRLMARSQQVLRIDHEESEPASDHDLDAVLAALCAAEWDALILSDYGKGVLTDSVLRAAIDEAARRGVPCVVDPKGYDYTRYQGACGLTPNLAEAEAALGRQLPDREALAEGAADLIDRCDLRGVLITLGPDGMFAAQRDGNSFQVPTAARAVFDVTGAGDTVVATLTLGLAAGLPFEQAVLLANAAAGIVVAKVGTATVGRDELLHALEQETTGKVVAPAQLTQSLATLRRESRRVVFTNGCFDLFHAGHVRVLQQAATLGDALVVGVNDDGSVRRLKGEDRPFNSLEDRMDVLAALACVDLVVPFSEDTPENLIRSVCPDVLVKGADWREGGVVGADFVTARGGEVRLVEIHPGRSTTRIAEKIRGE